MSKLHILSEAQITASEGDAITVVLVEPDDLSSKIIIHWPPTPTGIPPRDFADVAALLTRVFARAATKLSQIRAQRK